MTKKVLVGVAGLSGSVGSTFAVGLHQPPAREDCLLGSFTESTLAKQFCSNFLQRNEIILTGWDPLLQDISARAEALAICPSECIASASSDLTLLRPRSPFKKDTESLSKWIATEGRHLQEQAAEHNADELIIINLCPTERLSEQKLGLDLDWNQIPVGTELGVTPSRIYLRLAIEAGAHYINFTPNHAEIPALCSLAAQKNLLIAGRDGKTGQTFLKSVLATAFSHKNLKIDGWSSFNLLGNSDGQNLADEEIKQTKRQSKKECLEPILGYEPFHSVEICYYPPRGDAKEAWDSIDLVGFLGVKMQLKLNFLGADSILAAPVLVDLIRLVYLSAKLGIKGLSEELNFFFKSPIGRSSDVVHSYQQQTQLLLSLLTKCKELS